VKQLGPRLPTFTDQEQTLLKGSNDFYGMNHYCANYIKHYSSPAKPEDVTGNLELLSEDKYGNSIGPETQSFWLRPHAPGFRKLMKWLSDRYGHPKFYVTENGTSVKGENDLTQDEILNDEFRVEYFRSYIKAMAEAVAEDGVDCRGYMAWSLMEYVTRLKAQNQADRVTVTLNGLKGMRRGLALRSWTTPTARRDIPRRAPLR